MREDASASKDTRVQIQIQIEPAIVSRRLTAGGGDRVTIKTMGSSPLSVLSVAVLLGACVGEVERGGAPADELQVLDPMDFIDRGSCVAETPTAPPMINPFFDFQRGVISMARARPGTVFIELEIAYKSAGATVHVTTTSDVGEAIELGAAGDSITVEVAVDLDEGEGFDVGSLVVVDATLVSDIFSDFDSGTFTCN